MQSGCPHNQGRIYSAQQHQVNVDSLKSPQNSDTLLPVVHPANGIQTNTVANQYPVEFGVAYSPAATISPALKGDNMGRGLHSSVPENKKLTSNPLLYALLKANSPDYSSPQYFKKTQSTSPDKTTINIEHDTSSHFPDERHNCQQVKSLPLALNGEHTKAQNLDRSGGTNFTYCQPPFTFSSLSCQMANVPPTDDQIRDFIKKRLECYTNVSTQQSRKYDSITTSEDNRDFTLHSNSVAHLPTSVSEEYVERKSLKFSVIEQYSSAEGQAHKDDHTKSIKANVALTPKSTVPSEKHSTGTLVSAAEQSKHALKNESAKKSASIDFDLPFKKHMDVTMFTNACGKCVCSDDCGDKTFFSTDESFHSKWIDKYIENGMANLHYSLTALKELIASLEKVEIIAEVENFSEVILQQYWDGDIDNVHLFTSTEYPQIMVKVAATCTKNEDESPVVLTAVSPMTLDELTKKHSNSLFNCSSSHEEHKSPSLSINKNLDEMDKAPDFYRAIKSITEQDKNDIDPNPVEAVGWDNVQGVNDVSEAFQSEPSLMVYKNRTSELTSFLENQGANTKISRDICDPQPCHITCKEVSAHSKMNSSIKIFNVVSLTANKELCKKSCEDARKDGGLVHSQMDSSVALSENEVREQPSKSENEHEQASSVNNLKAPQYEDISDYEDTLQLLTKPSNLEEEELRVPACFEDLQYEDISEDENPQIENIAIETTSLKKLPENVSKRLTFENEGCGHVQGQAQLKTEVILVEKLIPKKQQKMGMVDTDQLPSTSCLNKIADDMEHLSRPKCNRERPLECQTNCSSLCSHFSLLKDETDDQMDDDWIVLPISMSDLKFEPEEAAQDDPGVIVLQDSDTESIQSVGDTSPKEQRLHQPASNPIPASVHSQIEEFDTLESFLQAKITQFGKRSSRSTPTEEMELATEPHKAQNRRDSYSESEDSCETDDSCNYSPALGHNYLTVTRHLLKTPATVLSDKSDSVPEKSEHWDTNTQIFQTRGLRLQKLKELMDARAGSKHVQPKSNRQKISKKEDIIVLDSETEDESDQNCKKEAKRSRVSSSSEDRGDFSCSQQSGHLLKTVDNLGGTFKEKLQDNTHTPYVDLPAPQHHSELEPNRQNISTQESVIILDSDTEDESDKNYQKANSKGLLFSGSEDGSKIRKTEQLTEAKGYSEHIHKDNRQTTSKRAVFASSDKVGGTAHNHKKKAAMERILSSGSDDSGSASAVQNRHSAETMNNLYGTTNEEPQKTTLSSKESPDKLPQSVSKEADSTLCHNPVIPRLFIQNASQPSKCLKLAKASVGTFCKDETQTLKTFTATSKKTVSRDLDRNDQDRCVPKSKSGNERDPKKKNKVLINVGVVSRQSPLSSQEGPSTSISRLTSPDGQLSKVRQSSASSKDLSLSAESSVFPSLSKSKPSTSDPTHLPSSKLKRSFSYSNTSTLDNPHSPTQGLPSSAPLQLPAKERAMNDWYNSFVPLKRGRRSSLRMESSRTTSCIINRNARPTSSPSDRAPRQRHNSHKSTTPLMKKTKFEAIQRTKDINRDTPREQRSSVGKGFKWLEKPTLSRPNSRCKQGDEEV